MPLPRAYRSHRVLNAGVRAAPSTVPFSEGGSSQSQRTNKRKRVTATGVEGVERANDNDNDYEALDFSWPEDHGSVFDVNDLEGRIREDLERSEDVRQGQGEEEYLTELPLDLDLQDLQQADQYEDVLPQVEDQAAQGIGGRGETLADFDFDDTTTNNNESPVEAPPEISLNTMLPPQSRRPSDDQSDLLPQPRIYDEDPQPFTLALGLWCEEAAISRPQYSSLREILRMLEPHPLLKSLPSTYGPLRRRTKGHLPQLPLRKALLPLIPEKMPSLAEQSKEASEKEASDPKEYLYWFDPCALFQSILKSTLVDKMHFGFGEFRDNPVELWQSNCWTASVRTTSGLYAHYRNSDTLFPSDWVLYLCGAPDCQTEHLGRVVAVGLDYRDATPPTELGRLKIKVQHTFWNSEIPIPFHRIAYFRQNEVLLQSAYSFLSEDAIVRRHENVFMDYGINPLPQPGTIIVRSLFNKKKWIQPLRYSSPLRAELELQTYGRDYFCNNFDRAKGNRCLSLPFMLFIDGFGLYRNAYRSLMGVYVQIAAFAFHERMRRANVFPLTLGPHGSNLNDVINALQGMRHLDKGVILDLPQPTRVCAFTLCFLGDMPQQQANAGFKSQRANLGCRFCLIPADSRKNLDYDIIQNGRFHLQTMQQRQEMSNIRSIKKREDFASQWGLSSTEPALFKMAPALDIILTRPGDPAHSEYAGLCKQLHTLLLETILTAAGATAYATVMRRWPFAPGFGRLQSPIHHLKSYSLSEHARWIVIVPALLRCWLTEGHLQPYYLDAARSFVSRHITGFTPTELITRVFALVAESTCMLMTDTLIERIKLRDRIKDARKHFQLLLDFAASAANINPRSRSRSTTPRRTSVESGSGILPSIEAGTEGQISTSRMSQKAVEFQNDQRRPNMHTAIHYETIMQEYGMPSNVNVLIGEDKHRWFKKVVYQTNHINVEKHLLVHESLRQSVRLILMDSFKEDEPQVTAIVKDLSRKCPTLFETLLTRSEQRSLYSSTDFKDDEDTVSLQSDEMHQHVTATGGLTKNYCKTVLKVPIRASDTALMTESFKSQLRSAFAQDYGLPNIVHFGFGGFRWCRKLSFTSSASERRHTFAMGDFIKFHGHAIGRIDGLLIVKLDPATSPRLFCTLTVVEGNNEIDPILNAEILRTSKKTIIVGVPAIGVSRLYMVPVDCKEGRQLQLRQKDQGGGDEPSWLMIPWDVQYL